MILPEAVTTDAGTVAWTIDPRGVTVVDVAPAPGWVVTTRAPRRRFRRDRPAEFASIIIDEEGSAGRRWEVEVSRLPDGTWEAASNERLPSGPSVRVDTPAGAVTASVRDEQITDVAVTPAAGWSLQQEHDEDLVVILTRGGEAWEVVVMPTGRSHALVERERRWLPSVVS